MTAYRLDQVIAEGCAEPLLTCRITLPNPAWAVLSVQKTMLIDRAETTLGSALLQGRLRACYTLLLAEGGTAPPPLGTSLLPGALLTADSGPLYGLTVDAALHLAVPLPGADPGQGLTLTAAHVTGQQLNPLRLDAAGRITDLLDQSLVRICLRSHRSTTWNPPPGAADPPASASPSPRPAPPPAASTQFASPSSPVGHYPPRPRR